MTSDTDVLVVGAGVSGLTTGVCLAESGIRVRIRAEREPAESSSAAAGAIWDPIYANHPRVQVWAARSYDVFVDLAGRDFPGVRVLDGVEASRIPMATPGWALSLPGYRECAPEELPGGFVHGWHYTAPIIDMPAYLDELQRRLAAAGGELLFGERLQSLSEGFADAPVVINCSGVGARELVPDPEVEPIRGQLVAVRNPGLTDFFAEHTDELGDMTYLLPQGDVLLLGGSAEKGEAEPVPDRQIAQAIVDRCSQIFPAIRNATIIGHRTGIRPSRPEVRLEHDDLGNRHIVHNYGHSGAGVSLSWGCAEEVARLCAPLLGH
ncbi:FAD-dependent oxidoreductase [Paractinoplanes brasiliensis]|uniref:D-amino-acid oxidase n=1 Tax=Paractinoplanes brasiliensis TaxID=52695 RepID=A0A4R6K196_9ACTN|nr:FAD-dependent oxidoreductase [Actinoplanes brasiliensis]TDO42537.1 D-amino-acid:oxygen oxidoreductase (deaminating) [Actinoplanes brasiliensis]GID31359.1 amino acid oxidase [Actinoplanes brasiliensis]